MIASSPVFRRRPATRQLGEDDFLTAPFLGTTQSTPTLTFFKFEVPTKMTREYIKLVNQPAFAWFAWSSFLLAVRSGWRGVRAPARIATYSIIVIIYRCVCIYVYIYIYMYIYYTT